MKTGTWRKAMICFPAVKHLQYGVAEKPANGGAAPRASGKESGVAAGLTSREGGRNYPIATIKNAT